MGVGVGEGVIEDWGVTSGVGVSVGSGVAIVSWVVGVVVNVGAGLMEGVLVELGVTSGVDVIVANGMVVAPGVWVAKGVEAGTDIGVGPVARVVAVEVGAGSTAPSGEDVDVVQAASVREANTNRIILSRRIFTTFIWYQALVPNRHIAPSVRFPL